MFEFNLSSLNQKKGNRSAMVRFLATALCDIR